MIVYYSQKERKKATIYMTKFERKIFLHRVILRLKFVMIYHSVLMFLMQIFKYISYIVYDR